MESTVLLQVHLKRKLNFRIYLIKILFSYEFFSRGYIDIAYHHMKVV